MPPTGATATSSKSAIWFGRSAVPYGLEHSLTFGIVSAKSRRSTGYDGSDRSPYQEYLQTDAAVNPGNSGGPLVNIEGQIVGINAAIFGPSYQGISFSIPSCAGPRKIR